MASSARTPGERPRLTRPLQFALLGMFVVVVVRFVVTAAGSSALDWLSVTGFGVLVTLTAISPPRPWSLRGKASLGFALTGVALHWWADVQAVRSAADAWPVGDVLAFGCWGLAALAIRPERARWTRANAVRGPEPAGAAVEPATSGGAASGAGDTRPAGRPASSSPD